MFKIEAAVSAKVGFASHQNAVPLLREIAVVAEEEAPTEGLQLRLISDPPFVQPKTWRIERVSGGDTIQITDRVVELNATYLSELAERVTGTVILSLQGADGVELARS